jgi:tyrosyl-tRNA synthetase
MVNNNDWFAGMDVLSFLRDMGKHFSVNAMSNKESVKQRLSCDAVGISFTEFAYSLLQSDDFAVAIKLPPAKPEVYCWGASKALVNQEPPKGG